MLKVAVLKHYIWFLLPMQKTECISTSNTTFECVMPQLDSTYYGEPGCILAYSLMFGNFMTGNSLAISVQPNPTFGENSLHKTDISEGEVNPLLEIEMS